MANITTAQAGDWSVGATWTGGVKPSSTDTFTINHAVTVDSNHTVAGGTINAALTVANGVTLTITGAVTQGNGAFALGTTAGAHLIADTTGGSFSWTMGTGNGQTNCNLISNGTSGSHATVTVTGGNRFDFTYDSGFFHSGGYDFLYCDFAGVRNAAGTSGFRTGSFGLTAKVRFRNCTFSDCGAIYNAVDFDPNNGEVYQIDDCVWTNTPSGQTPLRIQVNKTAGANNCRVLRCSFDREVTISKAIRVEWTDCYFADMPAISGAMTAGTFTRNFVRMTSAAQTLATGIALTDCYLIHDQTTGNPHWLTVVDNTTYDRLVFDYPHPLTFDTGDAFLNTNATGIIIQNCLMLPSESDGETGGFLGNLGSLSATARNCKALHNTVCGEFAMVVYLKDPGYIQNGQVWSEVKSNICYSPTTGTFNDSSIVFDLSLASGGTPAAPYDVATGSGCTHNGIHNGIAYTDPDNGGVNYTGYLHRFPTSGTPGSNDVVADPQFFDYGRNLARWAVHKGAATSGQTLRQKLDAGLALLAATPTLAYTDLIPWVRAGYAPTNPAYRTAAHDGTVIGAVQDAPPSAFPPTTPVWRHRTLTRRGIYRGTRLRRAH